MSEFIVDNVAKIIDKEKSVLDIFKEKINKAIEKIKNHRWVKIIEGGEK